MKKGLLILAMSLVTTYVFAGTGDIGSVGTSSVDVDATALEMLLTQNPLATGDSYIGKERVSTIVARGMVSYFDTSDQRAKNFVGLTVTTHSCEQIDNSNTYRCDLNMHNSDRVVRKDGSYAQAPDMTESAYIIYYKFTLGKDGKHKISDVKWFLAG